MATEGYIFLEDDKDTDPRDYAGIHGFSPLEKIAGASDLADETRDQTKTVLLRIANEGAVDETRTNPAGPLNRGGKKIDGADQFPDDYDPTSPAKGIQRGGSRQKNPNPLIPGVPVLEVDPPARPDEIKLTPLDEVVRLVKVERIFA